MTDSYASLEYDPRFGSPYPDSVPSGSFEHGIEREAAASHDSLRIPDKLKLRKTLRPDELHTGKITTARKQWLYFCACMTWWVPDFVLGWAGMPTKGKNWSIQ